VAHLRQPAAAVGSGGIHTQIMCWSCGRADRDRRRKCEGRTKPLEREFAIARRPRLETDGPAVADVGERQGHGGAGDLTGARFAATRDVGNLHLANEIGGASDRRDDVALTDLRVIDVEPQD